MFEKLKEKRELKKQQEEAARRAREAAEIAACNELAKTIVNDRYQEILKQYSYVQESWFRHEKIVELEFLRYSYRSSELYVRVNPYDGRGGYREFSYSGSMGAIMSAIKKELSKKISQLHISSEGPVTKKEERISAVVDGDDFVTWYEEHGKIIIKVLPKERPNVMGPQVMPYFPPFTPTSSSSTSSQNTNNPTKNTNTSSQNSSASSQSVYPSSERQEKINKMFAGRYDIKHTLKKLQKMNEILEKQNIMTASEQTSAPASPKPVAQTPEESFDVFICYKEYDDFCQRTLDSVLAQDLYYQLTKEGFKVFFLPITLKGKLGSAYEPYMFAALNSAKVMVVLGTEPESFNAVEVKNEWSRYLALIKQGQKKILIPAYKDMHPYDLPQEFSCFQKMDMSTPAFVPELIRVIKKSKG